MKKNTLPKILDILSKVHMPNIINDYKLLEKIAHGSYGIVCNAVHTFTQTPVVIKNIYNCLLSKHEMFLAFKELSILYALKNTHENIISMKDAFIHANSIYIVFEKMNSNLQDILNKNHLITNDHIQHLLYILLKTLDFLHDNKIIHRDIKPTNILVSYPFQFKICDFGMSYYYNLLEEPLDKHVVTRWYRAPEICLHTEYSTQIDMWSVGCILAELLSILRDDHEEPFRTPTILFPGKSNFPLSPDPIEKITHGDQLVYIMRVCGTITEDEIESMNISTSGKLILEQINPIVKEYKKVNIEDIYPSAPPEALDLLKKMLVIDPTKRITAKEALEHCYFNEIKMNNYQYEKAEPVHDILQKIDIVEKYSSDILFTEIEKLIEIINISE